MPAAKAAGGEAQRTRQIAIPINARILIGRAGPGLPVFVTGQECARLIYITKTLYLYKT